MLSFYSESITYECLFNNINLLLERDDLMKNKEIRYAAMLKGVKHWEIAQRLGTNASYLSKKLREELPKEEQDEILAIIDQIAKERGC